MSITLITSLARSYLVITACARAQRLVRCARNIEFFILFFVPVPFPFSYERAMPLIHVSLYIRSERGVSPAEKERRKNIVHIFANTLNRLFRICAMAFVAPRTSPWIKLRVSRWRRPNECGGSSFLLRIIIDRLIRNFFFNFISHAYCFVKFLESWKHGNVVPYNCWLL